MYISEEIKSRIVAEIQRCINLANKKFNQTFQMPRISYDVKGTTAGYAVSHEWCIKLNAGLLAENAEETILQTVPHEFAHLVDAVVYKEERKREPGIVITRDGRRRRNKRSIHGPTWKSIMVLFGKKPDRCHKMDTSKVKIKKGIRSMIFNYKCSTCSVEAPIGYKHHRMVQSGMSIISLKMCRRRHGMLKASDYVPDPALGVQHIPRPIPPRPTIVPTPKLTSFITQLMSPPKPRPTSMPGTRTKQQRATDIVRTTIHLERSEVIKRIMTELDMTQAGASTYYYNAKKLIEQIGASKEAARSPDPKFWHSNAS